MSCGPFEINLIAEYTSRRPLVPGSSLSSIYGHFSLQKNTKDAGRLLRLWVDGISRLISRVRMLQQIQTLYLFGQLKLKISTNLWGGRGDEWWCQGVAPDEKEVGKCIKLSGRPHVLNLLLHGPATRSFRSFSCQMPNHQMMQLCVGSIKPSSRSVCWWTYQLHRLPSLLVLESH